MSRKKGGVGLKSTQQESKGEMAVMRRSRSSRENDNEARCDLIISRLPNRFKPKTTASATGEKSIPRTAPSVKASHGKIEIINDRQPEWMLVWLLAAQW